MFLQEHFDRFNELAGRQRAHRMFLQERFTPDRWQFCIDRPDSWGKLIQTFPFLPKR